MTQTLRKMKVKIHNLAQLKSKYYIKVYRQVVSYKIKTKLYLV